MFNQFVTDTDLIDDSFSVQIPKHSKYTDRSSISSCLINFPLQLLQLIRADFS